MEKDKLRLSALDGLRGFAIILVFLNHINTSFVQSLLPQWLFGWIWSNGVTGVTFLFILSGFLMSTIYPSPVSSTAFWQKRYTRIFPLFLTMCVVMFVGGLTNTKSPLFFLEILFCCAIFTYIVWVFVVKKLPKIIGQVLFFSFLLVQIFAAGLYIFWINKLSFATFTSLPTIFYQGSILLINTTLTLPLGQYVPMLDGVYWTLVAEVLFYILYPVVVVPLAKFLAYKPLRIKILFLLSLIPLFGGIDILSYKIFVLSLIQPALFFYFATGVFLGYLFRNHTVHFEKFSKKYFTGSLTHIPFLLFFLTLAFVNDLSFLGQMISPWIRMLFAIPLTFLVAILLDKQTLFSRFFSNRILTYIGTVSYSIYLSHSLTIHMAGLVWSPNNILSDFLYILVVFACTVGIASILFFLLERPYFQKRKEETKKEIAPASKRVSVKHIFIGITAMYLIGVVAAYQSPYGYNFFSTVVKIPLQEKDSVVLTAKKGISFSFQASDNDLGLIAMQLSHRQNHTRKSAMLVFTLQEKGSAKTMTETPYNLNKFDTKKEFPFGFPQIAHAKGKTYLVHLTLINADSSHTVSLNPMTVQAIYSVNKGQLIKHPLQLISLVENKLENILQNQEALLALALLLPFLIFGIIVVMGP